MNQDVLKSLARLMQQTAVKQAVQECALRRLLALLPPDHAAEMASGLREDVAQVMESFSGGIDQPAVDATITFELNAMLEALGHPRRH
jgi:threonine aldolase